MVRLGAGGLDGKALTPSAMSAALQALSKFRRLADSHDVDEIIAAATSATREAENGGDFLDAIHRETGIARDASSPASEEARLIHLAAAYGVDLAGKRGVVIDIGGGSVEITFGTARGRRAGQELQDWRHPAHGAVRAIRSARRPRRAAAGRRTSTSEIGAHVDQIVKRGYQRVIGTSGTILSLGSVVLAAETRTRSTTSATRACRPRHCTAAQAARRLRPAGAPAGARPRSAARPTSAVAGSVLLDTILRRLGADELTLCDLALREGLDSRLHPRNRRHIATIERYPRHPTAERRGARRALPLLVGACAAGRAARDSRSSTRRRRCTASESREREWLEFGALLHDVGVHISYKSHHKHSYYLIRNGDLRGFEPQEIEVIALIARYHRQADAEEEPRGLRHAP